MRQIKDYGIGRFILLAVCLILTTTPFAQDSIQSIMTPDTLFSVWLNAHSPIEGYIRVGNFSGDHQASDINLSTIIINNQYVPEFLTLVPYDPDFNGKIIRIGIYVQDFIETYPDWWDTTVTTFAVSGQYKDGSNFGAEGTFLAIGHISGDINGDLSVNISDAVYLINTIFRDGPPPPQPYLRADTNGDLAVNVGDAVYLISYIFRNGPAPSNH